MVIYNVAATIEIDGTPVKNYISLQIDQRFNEHHQFSIKLPHDVLEKQGHFSLNNVKKLIGKVTIIRLQRGPENKVLNEFKGVISDAGIQQTDAYHSVIILNGYSPTIILDSGPHVACFIQKDLKKICQDSTKDISGECNITISPVYKKQIKYFTQYKESNFEFLNRLSEEFGEWFFYNGKELFFGKPASSKNIELVCGEDVTGIQLKMQLLPLSFKSFSYQSKGNNVVTSTTPSKIDGLGEYGKFASNESDKLFNSVVASPVLRPRVENKSELDNFLKIQKSAKAAQLEVISGASINPEIIPGCIATINISTRTANGFSKTEQGKYLIISVSHQLSDDGKYSNTFEGLPAAVEVVPVKNVQRPMAETQIGVVKNNNDPDNLGRVKVSLLWHDHNITTDWIRVMTSDGGTGGKTGKNRGFVFIPEVNDQVLVGFRYNDPDRPFVMGSLFHGKSASGGGKDNKIKTLSTNSGNTITLNDDKGSVMVEDAKGNSILFNGAGLISVHSSEKIEFKCGDSSITLTKDGNIKIEGKMKIEVNAGESINMEGKSEVAIKSTNITAKANSNLNLEGTAVAAKANAKLSLEGSATAKLSSGAMVEISATLVKIN